MSAALVLLASCSTTASEPRVPAEPEGPPRVRKEVVERHAAQFDGELRDRPAGSQKEFLAATYLLGHLQKAGYVVRLDAVPVGDLVRSTNVVARPPDSDSPSVVVTVDYDSTDGDGTGLAVGTYLELARAVRVQAPDADIHFVALGAENTALKGGQLGSRRLARVLLDQGVDPLLVTVGRVSEGVIEGHGPVVSGSAAKDLVASARSIAALSMESRLSPAEDVWAEAGFRYVSVSGTIEVVPEVLLRFLVEQG